MDEHASNPLANVPAPLRAQDRWIPWAMVTKGGKPRKKPVGSIANLRDMRAWVSVAQTPVTPTSGIGFCFRHYAEVEGGGVLVALDLDACVDGDHVAPWAERIVNYYDSYTERTPSSHGLRVWLVVRKLARPWQGPTRAMVLEPAVPHGSEKKPQVQVFGGTGAAEYVTVTGEVFRGRHELRAVENLAWLEDVHGVSGTTGALAFDGALPLPTPAPDAVPLSFEQLSLRVRAEPDGPALIAGHWQEVVDPATSSASEAYGRLVRAALRASGNDGALVVDWLLEHTEWGAGNIEDSYDPAKYAKRAWVERDVARAGAGAPPSAAQVFQPLEEAGAAPSADLESPAPTAPPAAQPLLIGTLEFLRRRSALRWLVRDLMPRTGVVQVFGDPACGKTPVAMSLALHVATGQESWFGHEVDAPGGVVYMVGEDANGLGYRAEAELRRLGVAPESVDSQLVWTTQPGRLCDAEDTARWIVEIRRCLGPKGVRLLVVDTQARNFGAGDENDTRDMGVFIQNVAAIAQVLECLVLLVHHTGHGDKSRARGNSSQVGGIDGAYRVTREDGSMVIRLESTKEKNWARPDPFHGVLEIVNLGTDDNGAPITSVALRDSGPTDQEAEEDLHDRVDDGLRRFLQAVELLDGAPTTSRELAVAMGRRRNDVLVASRQALGLGLVTCSRVADGSRGKAAPSSWGLTDRGVLALGSGVDPEGE